MIKIVNNIINFFNTHNKKIDDEQILIEFIKKDYKNLHFASDKLKNNEDFMLMLDSKIWHYENKIPTRYLSWVLAYSGDKLKDNKNFVLKLLKNKASIYFSSDRLRDDCEIVLDALNNDPEELQYASDRLKDDKNFILSIMHINRLNIKHISKRLQQDKEVFIEFIKQNWTILKDAPKEFKDDEEIVLNACKYWYSTESWTFGYDITYEESNYVYEYVSDRLREIFKYENYYQILEKIIAMKKLGNELIKKNNPTLTKKIKI